MINEKEKDITIITPDYPAAGHMTYVFVQQLVHAMIDQGVKVTVVAFQSLTHALVHREKLLPRRSKGVTESGNEYEIYRPYTLSFGNNNPVERVTDWFNRRAITSVLKKIKSDVLYAHFWSSALPVYDYALTNGIPLFVACGEGDNALEDMVAEMPKEEQERLAKACSGVVSVSSENKRKCIDYGLAKADRIGVFPNCVNTAVFHQMDAAAMREDLGIGSDDFVIGFVGGFGKRKGPDRIAEAIKRITDPKIKSIFIGKSFKGYEYPFDCPGIVYKGPLDHELIPQYVNCCDVFVMPTQKEGCCNAIVEALALGLPVISSTGAFNDDILNEKNSIRVDADDVDALTEAIKKLKDSPELRKSMSEYSLSRHAEYGIEGRAQRILQFIENII